jgi:hypothetical protein
MHVIHECLFNRIVFIKAYGALFELQYLSSFLYPEQVHDLRSTESH